MPGQHARPGGFTLTATIGRAAGQRLDWIKNGRVLTSVSVTPGGHLTLDVVAAKGDWFSLVLRDAAGPTLYSNAIYTN